jgi:CRISPR-associated endonuclease Csn1
MSSNDFCLGIDLGVASVGTALISSEQQRILFTGSRIFDAGMDGEYEKGKEESKAATRRQKRGQRRMIQRRTGRLGRIFRYLQKLELLPNGVRREVLPLLQVRIQSKYSQSAVPNYFLRAKALDEALEPYELGFALMHLAQRRGFKSNRLAPVKDDEKEGGKVGDHIRSLQSEIAQAGSRTLGEYFAALDPHQNRIRGRYTHRSMFEQEFQRIMDVQQQHHAPITDVARERLFAKFFNQRPLKDQSDLIGFCEYEPTEKRMPNWRLEHQRMRLLKTVNNLRIVSKDHSERPLTLEQRQTLIKELEVQERLAIKKAKAILKLDKSDKFSLENGGETNLPGDVTNTRMLKALGEVWTSMPEAQKEFLLPVLANGVGNKSDEALNSWLRAKTEFSDDLIKELVEVRLPQDYARCSLKAARELLPHLELGLDHESAVCAVPQYVAATRTTKDPLDFLPPVLSVLPEIKNPTVLRTLTEMRKVVNALIREYGKPQSIRVELARDLKKTRSERQKDVERNRDREKLRDLAIAKIEEHGLTVYRERDVERMMLAMEAKWQCPYTFDTYKASDVLDQDGKLQVDHIVPRSLSLDNSFENKLLVYNEANRIKGQRTFHQWKFGTSDYERTLDLVRDFDSRFNIRGKLKRVTIADQEASKLLEKFSEGQLQATRYAAKLAAKYLGTLYGAVDDANGKKRVFTNNGQITAQLRNVWRMNQILNKDEPKKSRDDHRHHAVDAVVIAAATTKQVQLLSIAARDKELRHQRTLDFPEPWPGFKDQVQAKIDEMNVSLRPQNKLSGALHEETNYSRPKAGGLVHFRKPLDTKLDFDSIVDPAVRAAVISKTKEPDFKTFEDNWPTLKTKDGREIPIKRVRISKKQAVVTVGQGARQRNVISGSNHHMAVFDVTDAKGKVKWEGEVVSLIEANERKRQGVPIVNRDGGPGRRFLFTLRSGDVIVANNPKLPETRVWKVRSVRARKVLEANDLRDSRLKTEITKPPSRLWEPSLNELQKVTAKKVVLDPLGRLMESND